MLACAAMHPRSSRLVRLAVTTTLALVAAALPASAAHADESAGWSGSLTTFAYFVDESFVLPIAGADRGALHLEGRYQYEGLDTFSAWAGRRFTTGSTVALDVVAMAGAIAGHTNGLAPGLEASLSWKSLELYAESEYVFDLESDEGDFHYVWSQLSWSAAPWLTLGLAAQRTRTVDSELDFERGVFAGVRRGSVEVTGYGFDLDGDDPFAIVAVGLDF